MSVVRIYYSLTIYYYKLIYYLFPGAGAPNGTIIIIKVLRWVGPGGLILKLENRAPRGPRMLDKIEN